MADIDISVGELPEAEYFDGESILLVENQGIAERVSGAQIKGFLRSGNSGGGGSGGGGLVVVYDTGDETANYSAEEIKEFFRNGNEVVFEQPDGKGSLVYYLQFIDPGTVVFETYLGQTETDEIWRHVYVQSDKSVIYGEIREPVIRKTSQLENDSGFIPAPATAAVGQTIVVSEVDAAGKPTKWEAVDPQQGGELEFYTEDGGSAKVVNRPDQDNPVWSELPGGRLVFGMNKATAPVPFVVDGQILVNGTVIARNMADNNHSDFDRNRWGMHVFEAYATDDWERLTMLLDKHTDPETGRKMAEIYYYVQASHGESSYGPVKIGSDVALHSFDFSRDKFVANGEIIGKMPITLARISLTDDIDNTYETVAEADAAYEPETHSVENVRCLKYIALKNAKDGAMFYDTDRNRLVAKINTKWCDVPFEAIKDDRYEIFGQGSNAVYCTSVTLDKTEITLTKMDDVTLTPTILPENTTETPVWRSSDNGVAKVSNGVITPIAGGTAVITVTVGSQMASCTVTVAIVDEAALVGDGLEFYLNLRNMAGQNNASTQIVDSVGGVVCTTPSVAFNNESGFVTNDGLMLPTATTKLQWQYPVKTANVPNGYTYEITTKGLGDFDGAGNGFGNGYAHLFDFSNVLIIQRAQLSRRDSDNAIIQTWEQQSWTRVLEDDFYFSFDATQEHVYTNVCEADGSAKVYVDGVLAFSHASDGNFDHYNLQGTVTYKIPYLWTRQTPMEVASVRIYERALSADEVLQNAKFDASQRALQTF